MAAIDPARNTVGHASSGKVAAHSFRSAILRQFPQINKGRRGKERRTDSAVVFLECISVFARFACHCSDCLGLIGIGYSKRLSNTSEPAVFNIYRSSAICEIQLPGGNFDHLDATVCSAKYTVHDGFVEFSKTFLFTRSPVARSSCCRYIPTWHFRALVTKIFLRSYYNTNPSYGRNKRTSFVLDFTAKIATKSYRSRTSVDLQNLLSVNTTNKQ